MNKVILLYGLPAAGKLTIAKMLADSDENAYLIDNHYVHDFVRPFIGSHGGAAEYWHHAGNIHGELLNIIGLFYPKDKPVTYIFTQVIRDSDSGKHEMSKYIEFAKQIGAEFYSIALIPSFETLKTRCVAEERKQRKKLHTVEKMVQVFGELESQRIFNSTHPNHLSIDTSNMTIKETFQAVKKHLDKVVK